MFGFDRKAARAVFTAVVVLGALYCVYAIRTTLLLVVLAVFFSYMILPVVEAAERLLGGRVPRDVILGLTYAVVLTGIGLAATALGRRFAAEAAGLGQQLPHLLDPATLAQRLPLPGWLEPLRDRLAALLRAMASNVGTEALAAAKGIGAGVVTVAGSLIYVVVVPVFSFLLIRRASWLQDYLRSRANSADGQFWVGLLMDLNFLLSHYVRALVLLSLAVLAVYGTVLWLLGVPFALLLATSAAVLELIPVFGPLVAAVSIVSVALFSGYPDVLWLAVFVGLYRLFQDYVLVPYLMSEAVDVPMIAVVFGLLAGEELAGVTGIFLSVPVIAGLRIVTVRLWNKRPVGPPHD